MDNHETGIEADIEEILAGHAVTVNADGDRVFLCAADARLFAVAATCTHDGQAFRSLDLDGTTIRCPRHGARFDVRDGTVLRGPAIAPLKTYPVRIEGSRVIVSVRSAGGASPEDLSWKLALDLQFGNLADWREWEDRLRAFFEPTQGVSPATPFTVRTLSTVESEIAFDSHPRVKLRATWSAAAGPWTLADLQAVP